MQNVSRLLVGYFVRFTMVAIDLLQNNILSIYYIFDFIFLCAPRYNARAYALLEASH